MHLVALGETGLIFKMNTVPVVGNTVKINPEDVVEDVRGILPMVLDTTYTILSVAPVGEFGFACSMEGIRPT